MTSDRNHPNTKHPSKRLARSGHGPTHQSFTSTDNRVKQPIDLPGIASSSAKILISVTALVSVAAEPRAYALSQ